ncbi:HAD hydrolase-like protein [Escherichia coli]
MLLDSVVTLSLRPSGCKSWHGRRPMAVGTGSESAIAEALLAHLGLRRYFDAVVAAYYVNRINPRQTHFCCARSVWACNRRSVWSLKSADFGIQAARAAGMDAVDVRW